MNQTTIKSAVDLNCKESIHYGRYLVRTLEFRSEALVRESVYIYILIASMTNGSAAGSKKCQAVILVTRLLLVSSHVTIKMIG